MWVSLTAEQGDKTVSLYSRQNVHMTSLSESVTTQKLVFLSLLSSPSSFKPLCFNVYVLSPFVCISFSCAGNTHKHTQTPSHTVHLCPSVPRHCLTCHACLPHSWPADPVLGARQCQGLMWVTSSFTMSPLPPPAPLSIVRLTVSGLVRAVCSAGAARSICKWWKRARESRAESMGLVRADRAGRWADWKAPFLPWQ